MARRTTPLFLKRRVYRQRRLRDAARLLPLLGGFLLLLPILWAPPAATGASAAIDGVYLFVVWLGLVAVTAALAPALASDKAEDDAGGDAP
ncbi:hypothetical protein HYN69_09915 [Gemmobacter aquarius]|uniref:Uncharacterized protein n=1 Tax=Paragemmobacter aquarius TaxID=2169400 RepID=A0A2S0ULZ1_9RHOB|nr:hypothetical protein [Gemmobacter aquarius]AWB48780.1 hypothetical protein HYN69_09915 [Gemmobacter aquarius]